VEELERRAKEEIKVKYSTMYQCRNCGQRKTHERELQTRSGDEGGTIFVECLNCGVVWTHR
jgi:DNA-directed RNA polymerase subunit M/transcription elongation factor TFIIS